MARWLSGSLLTAIMLAFVAAAVGSQAKAYPLPPPVDPCLLIAPDKTLVMSIDGGVKTASSVTADYATRVACPYFIVDVWVPAGSADFHWEIDTLADPKFCKGVGILEKLYWKGVLDSTFTYGTSSVGGAPYTGPDAGPGGCTFPAEESSSLHPGIFGGVTWRVLAVATVSTLYGKLPIPVTVRANVMSH